VTTIEERLDRVEWEPSEGDTLLGLIVAVTLGELTTRGGDTLRYPILTVKRDDGLGEVDVRCSRGGLLGPVIAYGVANGDPTGQRVGIRYVGKVPTGGDFEAHRYRVAFENDKPAAIDWAALAASREAPIADTTPVAADPAPATADVWSKAEAAADESPF
jgi:hypothetical protein